MRASLVDYADGEIDPGARVRVERHASACAKCRADLAALRELAGGLRALEVPARAEDFWRAQRQAILRATRQAEPSKSARSRSWRPLWGGAGAAVLAAALLLVLRPSPPDGGEDMGIDGLGNGDIVELAEVWLGTPELAEDDLTDGLVPEATEDDPGAPASDLDDDELQRLEELIG